MAETISGGCLCGACRYETDAKPINVRVCHCRLCQQAIGAPFNARVLVSLDGLTMSGPVGWHHSSGVLRRGFCKQCGTTMFSERAEKKIIGLTMGSLDAPDRFAPTDHIWTSSKQSWLTLPDDVPIYSEGPPA